MLTEEKGRRSADFPDLSEIQEHIYMGICDLDLGENIK